MWGILTTLHHSRSTFVAVENRFSELPLGIQRDESNCPVIVLGRDQKLA
jgi:hypothetical protein